MKLVIAGHLIAAGALTIASVVTVKLVGALPAWVGVLVGLLLYAVALFVAKAEAVDEETL